nr:SDR family oxidoreductase [uncultured Flavobacterium sp.]
MPEKLNTIAILGCGWLGLPLAAALLKEGHAVKGSTTSPEKIALLEAKGIRPFLVALSEKEIAGDIIRFLENSEILIIDIPPKLRGENKENFTAKIARLIPHIEKAPVKKVLFVSSTSVYPDDNSNVNEGSIPVPDTESGKQLFEAEKLLQDNSNFRTTIVRFGGLIGPDRHPIKQLAGRDNLANPEAPVNIIHQEDCIGIILKIIAEEAWGETYNAVAPYHPTRQEFYHKKAADMNLAIPKFASDKPSFGKLISSEKIEKALGYSFGKNKL